jgi:hypothetical protein
MYFIEKVFKYKDYDCVVIIHNAGLLKYRCGYVSVPKDHPLNSVNYWDIDNNFYCHGGLTFSSDKDTQERNYPIKGGLHWLGFDCGHAGDLEEPKSYEYVEKECIALAEQFDKCKNADLTSLLNDKECD